MRRLRASSWYPRNQRQASACSVQFARGMIAFDFAVCDADPSQYCQTHHATRAIRCQVSRNRSKAMRNQTEATLSLSKLGHRPRVSGPARLLPRSEGPSAKPERVVGREGERERE
eukprot:1687265-Rhodomonas_salina.1